MTVDTVKNSSKTHFEFDEALELCGVGKYNVLMLLSCGLLVLAMTIDIFGMSVMLPAIACDLQLSTSQQGALSAVPLIGVLCSYAWGLCADMRGRRFTLLLAMPVSIAMNLLAGFAPSYAFLVFIKFLSACFSSSSTAAGFVLMGESIPNKQRSQFMFLIASLSMIGQMVSSLFALPILSQTFQVYIPWLNFTYRPWRLLIQALVLPSAVGLVFLIFLKESPKYLISKGDNEAAIKVLKSIHRWNNGFKKNSFPVTSVYLDELKTEAVKSSFLKNMWNQTAPLFKPPLLKNSLKLYYILLTAFTTATGFAMWVPTIVNVYLDGGDHAGETFCQITSKAVSDHHSNQITDCDNIVQPFALYAVIIYSGCCGLVNVLLTFIVRPLGKKKSTLLIFIITIIVALMLLFVKIPYLSLICFFVLLYVCVILANINTYLVELNPTNLRGMALCLSTIVSRGFGFMSIQLIASLMEDHCSVTLASYLVLIISGFITVMFLPPDVKRKENC